MTRPNFLHIGINKAASSWVWRVCQQHPEIYVPALPDNVNFFTVHYHRGLDWYSQQYFAEYRGQKAIGEFSNSYLVYPPAIERIARDLPGVRLTVLLRNPVERAFLSWAHQHLKNKPTGLDMHKGIGFPFEFVLHHHGHGLFRLYIEPGFYARHLERVYQVIPRERVLVELFDDLAADNAGFLQRYFAFLGVDPEFQSTLVNQQVNPDADDARMADWVAPEIREELREVYREDRERLEELLGRDLSHWR
ncbi:sulfotransferase domain-containing protein [bacterium]|nr:sulfotransferase domain-containing protein [bacterium]